MSKEARPAIRVLVADDESEVRDAYRITVEAAIAEWRAALASASARYELVVTDAPFGAPLRRAFAARQDTGH